jgi:hypothetical protein
MKRTSTLVMSGVVALLLSSSAVLAQQTSEALVDASAHTTVLHNFFEANGAYYACRARCGVRATKECKDNCTAEYKANRADGKLVLASVQSL